MYDIQTARQLGYAKVNFNLKRLRLVNPKLKINANAIMIRYSTTQRRKYDLKNVLRSRFTDEMAIKLGARHQCFTGRAPLWREIIDAMTAITSMNVWCKRQVSGIKVSKTKGEYLPQSGHGDDGVPESCGDGCKVGVLLVLLSVEHDRREYNDSHRQREH